MGASTSTRPSDWFGLRPEDRRDAFFGLATLLVIIAGHTRMETARDTLFLQELPARRPVGSDALPGSAGGSG